MGRVCRKSLLAARSSGLTTSRGAAGGLVTSRTVGTGAGPGVGAEQGATGTGAGMGAGSGGAEGWEGPGAAGAFISFLGLPRPEPPSSSPGPAPLLRSFLRLRLAGASTGSTGLATVSTGCLLETFSALGLAGRREARRDVRRTCRSLERAGSGSSCTGPRAGRRTSPVG
jgi:hypothetical protein